MQTLKIIFSLLLLAAISANLIACIPAVQAADLMSGISGKSVQGKNADAKFIGNTADFSLELFKKSISEEKNSLISPLSVLLALAMTANGADTQTLAEMESVLGHDIPLAELNEYLYSYVNNLPRNKKARLDIANSIWFHEDEDCLTVEKDFLQQNADYYNAAAYQSPFDGQTLKDINNWVKKHTDGMIEKILDQISPDAVMYLINAVVFDARWEKVYEKNNIQQGEFTNLDDSKQRVDFMLAEESIYLEDDKATGFIKPYANNNYSFVALLPNEGITIGDFIQGLTGEGFLQTINGAVNTAVSAALPKFSYDYEIQMNEALESMGMPAAFSPLAADFSKLGKSAQGNIYIGEVLHKTFIQVDELGTKAGAVTKVEMKCGSVMDAKIVRLDRPFVYAIIDNASKLPMFIGTVIEIAD